MKNKIVRVVVITTFILLTFLALMQFTDQVNWNGLDFIVMGILLLITGFSLQYINEKINKTKYKVAAFLIIITIAFLIWAELAVGVFGTAFAGS